MACWYLAFGINILPTDIPTKSLDVSTLKVDVGGRREIKISLQNRGYCLLWRTAADVYGRRRVMNMVGPAGLEPATRPL